jgi:protein involved in polysaccharide export with SLBB domain
MLSGCIVLEKLGIWEDPLVTMVKKPFKGDVDAEWVDLEDGDPKIRAGLVVKIGMTVAGSPIVQEIDREVNMKGEIMMSLIPSVKCAGLTIFELQEKLEKAYGDYYHEPQVTVSFAYTPGSGLKSPWGSVLVMGSVGREGPVDMPSTRDLTVTRVFQHAGGVSPLGDKTKVRVARRTKEGDLLRYRVNVKKIGEYGRYEKDLPLRPGDVVWVPETWY